MVDPVSGSASEIARQLAEQTDHRAGDSESATSVEQPASAGGFDAAMNDAESVEGPDSMDGIDSVDESEAGNRVEETDGAGETAFGHFMERLGEDSERLETMLERCRSGGEMDQRELLKLQGLIYGYSQRVEIATKVADKAAGGLKQMMNVRV